MGTVNKKNKIQTTKAECRSSFWVSAIRMPNQIERGIGRSFVVEIYGKQLLVETNTTLSELHRDILNAILLHNYKCEQTNDGHFRALFSLRSIRRALNDRISEDKIVEKLKEIKISNFFISNITDKKRFISFHIINKLSISKIENTNEKLKNLDKNDYYYFVEIDKSYFEFQDFDLKILIESNIVDQIIKIKEASIKKIIYYTLSQDVLNKDLLTILYELAILYEGMTKQRKSEIIKTIISQEDILKKFGIEIKKMENKKLGVFYKKDNNIMFKNADKKISEQIEVINLILPKRDGQALSLCPSLFTSREPLERSLE